jgi:hypothetical protein
MVSEFRVATSLTNSTGKSLIDYDAVGRVVRQRIQSVNWTGPSTTYTDQQFNYNLAGELTRQVDGRGYVTSYGYDNRGCGIHECVWKLSRVQECCVSTANTAVLYGGSFCFQLTPVAE